MIICCQPVPVLYINNHLLLGHCLILCSFLFHDCVIVILSCLNCYRAYTRGDRRRDDRRDDRSDRLRRRSPRVYALLWAFVTFSLLNRPTGPKFVSIQWPHARDDSDADQKRAEDVEGDEVGQREFRSARFAGRVGELWAVGLRSSAVHHYHLPRFTRRRPIAQHSNSECHLGAITVLDHYSSFHSADSPAIAAVVSDSNDHSCSARAKRTLFRQKVRELKIKCARLSALYYVNALHVLIWALIGNFMTKSCVLKVIKCIHQLCIKTFTTA